MRAPAYASRLLERRRSGDHPPGVTVILGYDWTPPPPPAFSALVALKPGDWRPRRVNWLVCTGLPVLLMDRVDLRHYGPYTPWLALVIGAEIAEAAAHVSIGDDREATDMSVLAQAYRYPKDGRFRWPGWWSDERDARARANAQRWLAEAQTWIAGRRVERCA